jgi:ATP-dependent Lon protease
VLARIVQEEDLLPFERDAVITLAEHGARVAARRDRLTARFGRLADLAREAAFLAREKQAERVQAEDVREAVRRTKRRADLPSRKFRQLIREGTIRIHTDGAEVGQINGLAVTHSGQLSYGFPARITSTIGAGSAGAINIEREAMLSGAIHTKGFYILGGLLRHLLRTPHPLAFSASIAFEQSYGGIDGDSASGAEMCCLLSALTEIPLRQDVAMTGAIDQHGHIQPVGATTEKIEGFYDVCNEAGLKGTEGVIIPRANLGDLMLREDVAAACAEGRFRVWAVDTIQQALEVLTGEVAGERDEEGFYTEDSLLAVAVERAGEYWALASRMPVLPPAEDTEHEDAPPEEGAAAEA